MAGWASDATKRLFEEMIARGVNCTIETVPWKAANDGAVEGSGLNKHDKVEVSPIETSLTCNDLPLRFLGDLRRIYTLFDYQDVVDSENGASFIVDAFIENGIQGLPEASRPLEALPLDAKVQIIAAERPDGKCSLLVHYIFPGGLPAPVAVKYVRGVAATLQHRLESPWTVKKATQLLLNRIPGFHARCIRVQPKAQAAGAPAGVANEAAARPTGWCPTPEEIKAGLQFIKRNLPEETEYLEQLEFSIVSRTNASPIHKWPASVVEQAIKRINTIRADATSEYFYPLLSFDLKPVFRDLILPRLLPFAREHGLFIAGQAGVGKTPLVKILAFLLCRFWCKEKGIDQARPSLRRGKKLERFRAKAQQISEMLLLDDPVLELLNWESLKDYFDLTEVGFGDGRYTDSKYCLNGPRALVTNVLNYDGEPDANVAFTVTHFWEMVKPTFGPLNDFHMKAIYKRCITLLICKHRVVLRLPNEDLEAECVTEYKEDDAHKDTLIDTNKLYLDKLRLGEHVKYPNYDLKVSEEVAWAEEQIKAEKRFDVPLNFRSIEAQQPQQRCPSGDLLLTNPNSNPNIHIKEEVLSDQQIAVANLAAQEMEKEGVIELDGPDPEQLPAPRPYCPTAHGAPQSNFNTQVKTEGVTDQQFARAVSAAEEMATEGVIELDGPDSEQLPAAVKEETISTPRLDATSGETANRYQKDSTVAAQDNDAEDDEVNLELELEKLLEEEGWFQDGGLLAGDPSEPSHSPATKMARSV